MVVDGRFSSIGRESLGHFEIMSINKVERSDLLMPLGQVNLSLALYDGQ
jgi:hypothetical protein